METVLPNGAMTDQREYAGFWIRFVAILLDSIIVSIVTITISFFFGFSIFAEPDELMAGVGSNLFSLAFGWLYYAGLESSQYQGTLGKQMMGIYVTDEDGKRISFLRATGRYFSKIISAAILLIGYIMAAFTAKKQALHDMIAGTLVVKRV